MEKSTWRGRAVHPLFPVLSHALRKSQNYHCPQLHSLHATSAAHHTTFEQMVRIP